MDGRKPNAEYDGYTSCPIVTGNFFLAIFLLIFSHFSFLFFSGKGKLLLAEFKYGGEAKETFNQAPYSWVFDQRKENYPMYALKKYVFPQVFFLSFPSLSFFSFSSSFPFSPFPFRLTGAF